MSLFSKLRMSRGPDDTLAKAVITPAVLTMMVDGSMDRAEIAQLSNMCGFSPIFASVDGDRFGRLIDDIVKDIQRTKPTDALASAAGALSPALRETAMCFAVRVACADGRIDDSEIAALKATAHILQIQEETFRKIIDVVAMMQRGPGE